MRKLSNPDAIAFSFSSICRKAVIEVVHVRNHADKDFFITICMHFSFQESESSVSVIFVGSAWAISGKPPAVESAGPQRDREASE